MALTIAEQIKDAERRLEQAHADLAKWLKDSKWQQRHDEATMKANAADKAERLARLHRAKVALTVGKKLGIYVVTKPASLDAEGYPEDGEYDLTPEFRAQVARTIGIEPNAIEHLPGLNSLRGSKFDGPELFEKTAWALARAIVNKSPEVRAAEAIREQKSAEDTAASKAVHEIEAERNKHDRTHSIGWELRDLRSKQEKLATTREREAKKAVARTVVGDLSKLASARDRLAALFLSTHGGYAKEAKVGEKVQISGRSSWNPHARSAVVPKFEWPPREER